MPRRSEKYYLDEALERVLKTELQLSLLNGDGGDWETWPDVAELLHALRQRRYFLSRSTGSAGRVLYTQQFDLLDQFLAFPDDAFKARFRMSSDDLDALVALLKRHSTDEDWHINDDNRSGGGVSRSIKKQVAVALYILGGQEETLEKTRGTFGIGKGSAYNYLWRTINVICRLVTLFIRWPTREEQRVHYDKRLLENEIFAGCLGYIDGSDIVLNERPQSDWELYYGRKCVYGFNLQAVCNDDRMFVYAQISHRVSAHDSSAFKASSLYRHRQSLMLDECYIIGDKAYEIDKHVITPFRANHAMTRVPYQPKFNNELSNHRIRIEHSFGMLKERFSSIYSLPTHIRDGALAYDLNRVQHWTLACMCLHNFLRMRELDMPLPEEPTSNDGNLRSVRLRSAFFMRNAGDQRRIELAEEVYRRLEEEGRV